MLATDVKRPEIKKLEKRARLPFYFRVGAAVVFAVAVAVLIGGYVVARRAPDFRLKPGDAKLSTDVVATVNGYERTETEGEIRKYYVKADKATTFADNHQELQNVFIEIFDEKGEQSDRITSDKALYIPAENKNFNAYFLGNVNIETRDRLKVKTDHIYYKKETETAEAENLVEFERGNIRGKANSAFVKIKEKRLELTKDVEIDAFAVNPEDELARTDLKSVHMTSNYAMVDQANEKIELSDSVFINVVPDATRGEMAQPADIRADRAVAAFENKKLKSADLTGNVDVYQKPTAANAKWTRTKAEKATVLVDGEVRSVELNDNVAIETAGGQQKPTKITSNYAFYDKPADVFRLRQNVRIVTIEDDRPTVVTGSEAVYEQTSGHIVVTGGGEIDNGREFVKGDVLTADLFPSKKVRFANAKGSAFLRQTSPERTTEVSAGELNVTFDDGDQLRAANAVGSSNVVLTPSKAEDYTKVTVFAPRAIAVGFRGAGVLENMITEGRTTIQMIAPDNAPDAANKKLTADSVKTFFNSTGKDLSRAEAVGNAELVVDPRRASAENFGTTINAPRFDCDFFATGNNPRVCVGQLKTKTVRIPTVASERRGTQTLIADRLTAQFDEKSQDVRQLDAAGSAKFSELDRNGIAETITFTSADNMVRLRGGEPTVWDSSARAKAPEIDWDTKSQRSVLRGGVSTTYYSQKQTNGATPFGQTNKPVYVTAESGEFDHVQETGLYSGNARAWQENNYVRSDTLLLKQKEGRMFANGNVQSVLYDTKKREKGRESSVPVYASAAKMNYNRENRFLQYEENVDIRQGSDRITGGRADIYMNERNEMSKSIFEKDVVITQPLRRATGDWAQYVAADEIAILRGNPARIDDQENGASQGAQVTVYMRENRVVSESKTEQTNTGRTRTVYKVKKN